MTESGKMGIRDKVTLGLLAAMSFFLMCDVYITPGLVKELAGEFHVTEGTIGVTASAFTLIGAVISLLFGYMTDKVSRKKLLVLTVLIGEIPCFLTGFRFFTGSFPGFLALRILTGIGVGGIYPLTFSLLSDYFVTRHRATASAFVDIAWGLGMMVGPALAVFALSHAYGWRLAFIIAAVPNFVVAILFGLYARDPQRGRTEEALKDAMEQGAEYSHRISLKDFRILFQKKTNVMLFLQGIPGTVPWGLLTFWMIFYIQTVMGFTLGQAALVWEIFGVGAVLGGLFWAVVGDRLFQKDPRLQPLICTIGVFAGLLPCYLIINLPLTSFAATMLLGAAGGLLISVPASNNKAILMNINRPEHRGSVFSVFNVTDNIGKGVGPAAGSFILSLTGNNYRFMMNFAVSCWILCGILFIGVIFFITQDRKDFLALMEERAREIVR